MSDAPLLMALNCGSSSIKFALFEARDPVPRTPWWSGKVQGIGGDGPRLQVGDEDEAITLPGPDPYHDALALIRERTRAVLGGREVLAVAHRVVHGGSRYFDATRVDAAVLADLRGYIPLAPLHQPFALEAMEILLAARPDIVQVACFDTGFHHTLPMVEQLLPLPYAAWQRGLRRYGFHGLSYRYLSIALRERLGDAADGRMVVAHLGSGASLCAMQGRRSVATTMGFSALDGLMMGTRCGALDPGALLYLMEIEQLSLERVAQMLYHESGLLGVSGLSADPRALLAAEAGSGEQAERARIALELYVRRIVREIGAMAAVLGGIDVLVFSAGIGEHSVELRSRICAELRWMGVRIDQQANAASAPLLAAADSTVQVVVEPTNEEWIAASDALALLA